MHEYDKALVEDRIHLEQIKLLHTSIPSLLLVNVIVTLALAYGFWDVIPHQSILLCVGLVGLMVLLRGGLFLAYKQNFKESNLKYYRLSVIIGSAFAGIIWGLIGILFFPATEQIYQLYIALILLSMTGGSAFTLAIYLPCYFAYAPITLLPIAAYLSTFGDNFHISLAVGIVAFLIALTIFNMKVNKNFKTSLALRFENLNLIEQLKQQKDEAERANFAKSKFLAAASHDLRQPLYSLSLFTSVLDETITYPKVKKIVEQINISVLALNNLFDKLLDISQLDAGVVEAKKKDFSLANIFDKLVSNYSLEAQGKSIVISWPQNYPSVHSQEDLLERILRNYLSNAIKYTVQGNITVTCGTTINKTGKSQVVISVSDTGMGISTNDISEIYEEFYQISNPERDRQKGLGLGLSIVKRTAKLLEHDISVSSELGKGSTFSIFVDAAEHDVIESSEDSPVTQLTKLANSALVVVIDDEESIRQGLENILILWGYRVISASDLEQAMVQLTTKDLIPEAIISDYRLKDDKTGIDAIRAIHKIYGENIPALIMTGDIATDRLIDINSSNFQVLFKPVPPMKLRSFLRSIPS
ncbi:sensor histidine kinase [Brumicola nitratireducens]|uniref:histidine kinase n=1 Tax=Glaciecola nitratireducens (strain JCM 12485 / KCTC 12276 / FR1064) TaxID=1085623 RepID=G4QEX5_GLANF|nr:HAMP domain-containing sensor histidine kinase [Glaciecola nitratireducens]AEP28238.1 integral membrane sensor hybrid histidine kinase [Glaciecola nitratireducens FR1064]